MTHLHKVRPSQERSKWMAAAARECSCVIMVIASQLCGLVYLCGNPKSNDDCYFIIGDPETALSIKLLSMVVRGLVVKDRTAGGVKEAHHRRAYHSFVHRSSVQINFRRPSRWNHRSNGTSTRYCEWKVRAGHQRGLLPTLCHQVMIRRSFYAARKDELHEPEYVSHVLRRRRKYLKGQTICKALAFLFSVRKVCLVALLFGGSSWRATY